jgi:DNA-3-methyladenine glycosylase I
MATRPLRRCAWAGDDPLYLAYHDEEWGVPLHDDRRLFELLTLEGAQAGLAWITILRKREGYRAAFDRFDVKKVAAYGKRKIDALAKDARIVRHRGKIESATKNARATLAVVKEAGSLDRHLWSFVGGKPIQNRWADMKQVPAQTEESRAMSKDLKKRGFGFAGPTVCYAFMQAAGMVNDHLTSCFRHRPLAKPPRHGDE